MRNSQIRKEGFPLPPSSKNASCDFHRNTLTHVACMMNKKMKSVSTCKCFTEVFMGSVDFSSDITNQVFIL